MKRFVLITALSLTFSSVTYGGVPQGGESFLAKFDFEKDAVNLIMVDNVTDGCMPNPRKVKDAFEGELRRMGIRIAQKDPLIPYLFVIKETGFDVSGGLACAVYTSVSVEVGMVGQLMLTDDELEYIRPEIWRIGRLEYGSKPEMQSMLEDNAKAMVNDLYLELERAKD